MSLKGQRVLVTGAGGFIGSHLTDALTRGGAHVRAMVHYNCRDSRGHLDTLDPEVQQAIEVVAGDVCDARWMRHAVEGCDVVFHLAALIGIPYSYHAPQSYAATNFLGTLNVLEACRDCGVKRLVHTSTSEVYGTAQYTPMDEAHPLHAQSPYAATKLGADQLAYSYYASFGVPVVILRPFNTFGPRQSRRAVIPTVISQALAGDEGTLGNVDAVRDFLYVADNARGYMAAAVAEKAVGEVIQVGTGTAVTVGRVVELVGECLGKTLRVRTTEERRRPEKSEVRELICTPAKAEALLGWKPEVSLREGLEQTVRWIAEHPEPATARYVI